MKTLTLLGIHVLLFYFILNHWLNIPINNNRELRLRSHLSDSTLVIHLRLQYGGFRFVDLLFDIGTSGKLTTYKCTPTRPAFELRSIDFKNIMVALTDHSDDEGVDLFTGTASSAQPQAVP